MRRGQNLIGALALALVLALGLVGCAQDTAGSGGENGGGQIFDSQGNVLDAGSIPPHGHGEGEGDHSEGEGDHSTTEGDHSEGEGEHTTTEGEPTETP
ncbi:MAG TPA: hypothetical protein VFS21_35625 [Roseiflexaceae bacterium]|nr:hypothetical protein [Roseiflexaceae bacterium]